MFITSANICVHTFERAAPPARRIVPLRSGRERIRRSRWYRCENVMPSYTARAISRRECEAFSPTNAARARGSTLLAVRNGRNTGTKSPGANESTQSFRIS